MGREIQERIKCRSRIRIQKFFPQSRLADFVDGQILAFIPRITKTQLPVPSLEIIAKFPQLAAQTNIEEIILVSELFMSWTGVPTLGWWFLVGAADFNRDGHPDYVLEHVTGQTAIWYLSGRTFVGSAYGPTVRSGWGWAGTADFNGDGNPDYVLYNADTRQTAIWYLNNNVYTGSAWGPTLPAGWSLVAAWCAPWDYGYGCCQ